MKCIHTVYLFAMVAFVGSLACRAQQAANGPTFDATIAWLNDKIVSAGGFGYSVISSSTVPGDTTDHDRMRTTYQVNEQRSCFLIYTPVFVDKGSGEGNASGTEALYNLSSQTANSIRVDLFDLGSIAKSESKTNYGYTVRVDVTPDSSQYWRISGLFHFDANGKRINADNGFTPLVFADRDIATRVASALNHAIDVCGGKPAKPEPF